MKLRGRSGRSRSRPVRRPNRRVSEREPLPQLIWRERKPLRGYLVQWDWVRTAPISSWGAWLCTVHHFASSWRTRHHFFERWWRFCGRSSSSSSSCWIFSATLPKRRRRRRRKEERQWPVGGRRRHHPARSSSSVWCGTGTCTRRWPVWHQSGHWS